VSRSAFALLIESFSAGRMRSERIVAEGSEEALVDNDDAVWSNDAMLLGHAWMTLTMTVAWFLRCTGASRKHVFPICSVAQATFASPSTGKAPDQPSKHDVSFTSVHYEVLLHHSIFRLANRSFAAAGPRIAALSQRARANPSAAEGDMDPSNPINPFRSPRLMIAPLDTTVHLHKLHNAAPDQDAPSWTLDTTVDGDQGQNEQNATSVDTIPVPDGNYRQSSVPPSSSDGSLSRQGAAAPQSASAPLRHRCSLLGSTGGACAVIKPERNM
jgi:hypothetical protein